MSPKLRGLAAGIALIAMLAACGPKTPAIREVAIKMAWDTAGVALADGRGTFTTDLGTTVEADRLEVTAYSFELIPCDGPIRMPPPGAAPQQSSWSLIGTAWAGHRVGHPPTLTNVSRVQTPLTVQAMDFDRIKVPDLDYCQGHYLIARLPDPPTDPADAANIDLSLRVHGRYRQADDAAWTEFTIQTPVAHGVLVDFNPAGPKKGIRLKDGDVIVLTHSLKTLFDGVDFTKTDAEIARQVLWQIVGGTTLARAPAAGRG